MSGKPPSLLIPGFHAVRDALIRDPAVIHTVRLTKKKPSRRIREIAELAEKRQIPVEWKTAEELDRLDPRTAHQGILAVARSFAYRSLDDLMASGRRAEGYGLFIAADHITDEGNLGALIRSAAFFGAHGLILPKDRSAGVTDRVLKRSAGACLHLPVCRVVNLPRALGRLDGEGFWIIGAAGEAREVIHSFDWRRDTVLVMGREDRGLTRGVSERCHALVSIPGSGNVESLNVSVACGVILSEISRQRLQDP